MITLYGGGRKLGLPDASPFVTKTEVLLKMSGVPYERAKADFRKAPKGKIPYIRDGDLLLGDSTFIRWHLETKYGIDFDQGLSPAERATAWAFEKMVEEHLYWAMVHCRWVVPENFEKGPKHFFNDVPAPLRPVIRGLVKRNVGKALKAQGMGRHAKADLEKLGIRDLAAISEFLADKPWLMGAKPCGADASVWAEVAGVLCPVFDTPLRTAAEGHANLVAYAKRGFETWFSHPDLVA